jgi:hydrogenase-4 component B
VKFYGVVFLGQPREASLSEAHDANWLERAGLAWLALGCILIGVMPQLALWPAGAVTGQLMGQRVQPSSIWRIAPIAAEQASYSGLILLAGIVGVVGVTFLLVRWLAHGRMRRVPAWDCGYPFQNARMQDTAEGFGQPIRHMFGAFFHMERELPAASDSAPHYRIRIEDRLWGAIYRPIARATQWLADLVGGLQGGSLSIYLLYSFFTLIALLVLVFVV